MTEDRKALDAKARNALPDSAFAYIDEKGERHFPIHDKEHVQKALQLGPRSPMWSKAKGKVMAAAKKYGVHSGDDNGRSLESLFPEVRYIVDRPELRSAGEGEPTHITGYAAVFNKVSRRLGNFHEKVMPSAFTEALRSIEHGDTNLVCRYNHKDDMLLGTSLAGTLKVNVDEKGLGYDVLPPSCRNDVLEYVDRGDVRYSSFAFRVNVHGTDDTWDESEYGLPMRSLHNVELVDVAPVLDPAYKDTVASARNLTGAIESLASWVNGDLEEVRSILEAGQASRFFRRTDRSSVPNLDSKSSAEREESRVLDDPATSLRSAKHVEERENDELTAEEVRGILDRGDEAEIRAAMKPKSTDQLCMRFHHGEPCVRPTGHAPDGPNAGEGGHAGLCWGRHDGLPCNQHEGHDGDHTPMTVASRSEEDKSEKRSDEPVAPKTLTGPEAMMKMLARKKNLTAFPED